VKFNFFGPSVVLGLCPKYALRALFGCKGLAKDLVSIFKEGRTLAVETSSLAMFEEASVEDKDVYDEKRVCWNR